MGVLSMRIGDEMKERVQRLVMRMVPGGGHGSGEVLNQVVGRGLDELEAEHVPEANPTGTLAALWKRLQGGQPPSRFQWLLFADLIHDAYQFSERKHVRRENVLALGEAFLAIYDLACKTGGASHEAYLLGNIPGRHRGTEVAEAVRTYLDGLPPYPPAGPVEFFSRNLVVALRDLAGGVAETLLFRRLAPCFPILYPVAVTGLRERCRVQARPFDALEAVLPSLIDPHSGFSGGRLMPSRADAGVEITPLFEKHRLSLLVSFPPPCAIAMSFPHAFEVLGALRALLDPLDSDTPPPSLISQTTDASFLWNEHLDPAHIGLARGFLRANLPIDAVRTLRRLLTEALNDPVLLDHYAQWRVGAGDL